MFLQIFLRTLLPFGLPIAMVFVIIYLARSRFAWLQSVPLWAWFLLLFLLIAAWGVVIFLRWRKEKKDAAAIEAGILAASPAAQADMAPARRAELEQIQTNMSEAIAQLKAGPQGKKALYNIPWYMIIGPPAIGKTTAILNSGLNFPNMSTAKRLQGQGGTRNCDWWFSSDAILLDTAGRYAQSADRTETEGEWLGFLDLLKKHRGKNPLNGLILGYSFETLIDADDDKVIHDARELRKRIDETIEKIGFTFPVYLLFTKCDLVAGFADFFASLTPAERTQVWGMSFPVPMPHGETPATAFPGQFDRLLERLRNFRTRRLARISGTEDWGRVFMFPEELTALRSKLMLFMETLTEKNPFSKEDPIFRGAYFSSGRQMGTPLDMVVRQIQSILGSTGDRLEEAQPEKEDSYFVRDLFSKLIRADQDLSQQSQAGSKQWFRAQLVLSAVAGVLAIVASVYVMTSFSRLNGRMNDTKTAVAKFEERPGHLAPDIDTIKDLDGLRARVSDSWHAWPLSVASSVRQAGFDLYVESFRKAVLRPVESDVADDLENPASLDADKIRRLLQADLLMVYPDQRGRIGDEKDMGPTLYDYGIEDSEEFPELEDTFTGMCGDFLDAKEPLHDAEFRSEALSRGARALRRTHTTEAFFEGIVAGASFAVADGDLDMRTLTGDQRILQTDEVIRAAFTKTGWNDYVEDRIKDVRKVIEKDNELIVLAGETPAQDAPDRDALFTLYAESYPVEWAEFLGSIDMENYDSCKDAEKDYDDLKKSKSSPILKIAKRLADEADFGKTATGDIKKIETALNPVRLFSQSPNDEDPAPVDGYRKSLDDAHDLLDDCVSKDDFKFDNDDLRDAVDDIEEFLDGFPGDDLPDAFGELLKMPFEIADGILTGKKERTESGEANSKWKDRVFSDYASGVRGRYPFGSGGPASPGAIASVLGTGGGLDSYGEFLDESKIRVNESVRSAVRSAGRIRSFMRIGGGEVATSFKVELFEPRAMNDSGKETLRSLDLVRLTINGKELRRRSAGSNRDMNVNWSTSTESTECSIKLEHTSASQTLGQMEEDGTIWSWFKLVDRGNAAKRGSGHLVTWEFPDIGVAVDAKITMLEGGDCPFVPGSTFRSFRLPEAVR